MTKITNTTTEADFNPLATLFQTAAPGGIERQEAQGQEELVNSTQLPTEVNSGDIQALRDAGVKFGEACDGDSIFCEAELPEGWKKESTDHSMWSKLVDQNGCERASIFYKAAFYDREAFLNVSRRFNIDRYPNDSENEVFACVKDAKGEVKFATEVQKLAKREEGKEYDIRREHEQRVQAWLNENYPDWEDCSAYWAGKSGSLEG